jgi:hypothetical protein
MILTEQRRAAISYLLSAIQPDTLKEIYHLIEQPGWPGDYHFGVGIFVRNYLRQKFNWDEQTLNAEWSSLIGEAARRCAKPKSRVKVYNLPDLPPRLKSATLAAAENLAAIAHSEGLELGDPQGEATPHLATLLYYFRQRCKDSKLEPQPVLVDKFIPPQEIAAVLETIARMMVSEGIEEFTGHDSNWFTNAALVVEQMVQAQRKE